uniref:Uncharacterized protein n=1 Tax=Bionectria ochroleuca TaxID=29856 RepID=A0A0B7JIS0_BIOOC
MLHANRAAERDLDLTGGGRITCHPLLVIYFGRLQSADSRTNDFTSKTCSVPHSIRTTRRASNSKRGSGRDFGNH